MARRTLDVFWPDGDVDADDVAALLVDDGVDGDRGLADGAVADDQFALAAPEREQGVDDDQAGLHRLGHQVAVDDRRRRPFDRLARLGGDRSLAVERSAKRVDDASEQRRPDRHPHDVAGAAHRVAGFDRVGVVQQHAADAVALQHLGEAELALVEAHKFVEPHIRQAGDERDAVADLLDAADLFGARAELGGVEPGARLFEPEVGPVDWAGAVWAPRSGSVVMGDVREDLGRGRRANCWRRPDAAPRSSRPAIRSGSTSKATGRLAPNASPMSLP